ncbi:hypothetical protein RAB80_010018 [Fusarium oxysporum f. sp. vasinfectum]|nr:hypothetical protein RAB80_010018 [Fusarium oxysporum f. sp. vasinfectum]KAK2931466.1 hypothetical protein FoTM2_008976 [Fusarium oxysporum f. sp. vasinfectum]
MTSPPPHDVETPYEEFRKEPNDECERNGFGRSYRTPMTMADRDGSILYETEYFDLLVTIIEENDGKTLKRYLSIAPWAVPKESAGWRGYEMAHYNENYCLSAARRGCLDSLQVLLSHYNNDEDANRQVRFKQHQFELLNEAAQWGQTEVVQFLLDNQPVYASIHERDPNGHTAITAAANFHSTQFCSSPTGTSTSAAKNEEVVNLLLDRGASALDVVLIDNHNGKPFDTVLTLAAQWASPKLIKRLVDSGADVHAVVTKGSWAMKFWNQHRSYPEGRKTYSKVNALFAACSHANFEAVQTLIDCRGDGVAVSEMVFSRDNRSSIPIHWVTQSELPREIYNFSDSVLEGIVQNIANIIKLLLDLDPTTVNFQDNDGNTPLHYATRSLSRHDKQYTSVFQLLCNRGGDPSIRNHNGETPLHTLFRLYKGDTSFDNQDPVNTAAISILLAHGAKATDIDNSGDTPLHIAAANLHWIDAVRYLLRHGAHPAQQNLKSQTALHKAASGSYKGCTTVLTKASERIKMQNQMLEELVKAGGRELMDMADAEGNTPRHICQKTRDYWRERDTPTWMRGEGQGTGRGMGRGAPLKRGTKLGPEGRKNPGNFHHYHKWGFTFFRTYYGEESDEHWQALLYSLRYQTKLAFGAFEDDEETDQDDMRRVQELFYLDVREDPLLLEGLDVRGLREFCNAEKLKETEVVQKGNSKLRVSTRHHECGYGRLPV